MIGKTSSKSCLIGAKYLPHSLRDKKICLLMLSAVNLCKQFLPRSGQTKLFDTDG